MDNDRFDLYDRNAETSRVSAFAPRIRFVNYRGLAGMELPVWGRRRLIDYELILSLRGEFEYLVHDSGERVIQHPGEVLTIRPGELHTYRLLGDPERAFFSCIHLDFEGAAGVPEPPARCTAFSVREDGYAVHELFRRADQLFHRPGRFAQEQLSCVGKLIWLYLLEEARSGEQSERLSAMLAYLDENLLRHPTRSDLARSFRLTSQRINAIFKRELGVSPGEYVHRELAERGYALLHDEQLSVKEAADRLGFESPFYFSRVFRKVFGFSPAMVRRGGGAGSL